VIDFFRLPSDFPGHTFDSNRINQIENAIHDDFGNDTDLIPYIQRHELEALMFSGRAGFELVIDDEGKLREIDRIIEEYPNPEDINNNPTTAPSKRMIRIFGYDKTVDGEMILEMLGIESLLDKCPRFKVWIDKLVAKVSD
jgi:hypothetical protein